MRRRSTVGPDNWQRWVQWLRERDQPPPLAGLLTQGTGHSPLLWSLGGQAVPPPTTNLIRVLERYRSRPAAANGQFVGTLAEWLESAGSSEPTTSFALECLAWCHSLPWLAEILPTALWCELLEGLLGVAGESAGISVEERPLAQQILGGELPLTLAYLFPELSRCRALWAPASKRLSAGIGDLLDGEGLPRATDLPLAGPLLACWTRCLLLARASNRNALDAAAHEQYVWLVRQALRLTRPDGGNVFSPTLAATGFDGLLAAATGLANDRASSTLANHLFPTEFPEPVEKVPLPPAALHSEWSQAAILRQSWDPGSAQLALTYTESVVRGELQSRLLPLTSGVWPVAVSLDSHPLAVASPWEEVCWVTDRDGDYLELRADLAGGAVVQRQIFLARDDNFLLLADAVLGSRAGQLAYSAAWPLPPGVEWEPAPETREGFLRGRRRLARVLPFVLPEWRSQYCRGSLERSEIGLNLRQERSGQRLYAALFIDLEPTRLGQSLTWRRLTVAERLERVNDDVAVGYRVQIGSRHWLVYRSLGPSANRTVLGQNFSTEFVVARFSQEGLAEKLIEIE